MTFKKLLGQTRIINYIVIIIQNTATVLLREERRTKRTSLLRRAMSTYSNNIE